jgi:hypothetical protein
MVLWLLCDDDKMLVFVSRVMGIIDYKVCALVIFSINLGLYDGSLWNNGDSGAKGSEFYG